MSGVCLVRDSTRNTLPLMPGAAGANLCVRPVMPGGHAGPPLQSRTKNGDLIFWRIPNLKKQNKKNEEL
jgi:hypothetical protein